MTEERTDMERLELDVLMIRVNQYLASGRYVEARRALEHVLEEEPGHGIAHGFMGWLCWVLLDDADRATVHYRAAIRFAPGHLPHYYGFASMLGACGRLADLRTLVVEAAEVPGIDRSVLYAELAAALEKAGAMQESVDAYRKAVGLATDPSAELRYTEAIRRVRRKMTLTVRWVWR